MDAESLKEFREKNRFNVEQWRKGISKQKIAGEKLKDRNRKRIERQNKLDRVEYNETKKSSSSDRVRKHRESLKVKMDFCKSKRTPNRISVAEKLISSELSSASPSKRGKIISNAIGKLTPNSRKECADSVASESTTVLKELSNVKQAFKEIARKRDKTSNAARKLILKSSCINTYNHSKKVGINWNSVHKANQLHTDDIIAHAKTKRHQVPENKQELYQKVQEFYLDSTVSRTLPFKKCTVLVPDINGVKERKSRHVLEMSLTKIYNYFCTQYPDDKISQRKFELLRPKNVKVQSFGRRAVCGCPRHVNIDYIRNTIKRLLLINFGDITAFESNEKICNALLCQEKQSTVLC